MKSIRAILWLIVTALLFAGISLAWGPSTVTIMQTGPGTVTLSWDDGVNPPATTRYWVYHSMTSGVYSPTDRRDAAAVLTFIWTGLTTGRHCWVVTAYNSVTPSLESGYSNEVCTNIATITVTTTAGRGRVGTPYSAQASSSGGATPYTYSISAGALPTGVTMSAGGAFSGTPTVAGTYNFTVQSKDLNNNLGALAVSVVIDPMAPPTGLHILSQSASLRWFGVVLLAQTDMPAKTILQYRKADTGDKLTTVIATPTPTKTLHRAVLYFPPGNAYYAYIWTATNAAGEVVTGAGTFQTR